MCNPTHPNHWNKPKWKVIKLKRINNNIILTWSRQVFLSFLKKKSPIAKTYLIKYLHISATFPPKPKHLIRNANFPFPHLYFFFISHVSFFNCFTFRSNLLLGTTLPNPLHVSSIFVTLNKYFCFLLFYFTPFDCIKLTFLFSYFSFYFFLFYFNLISLFRPLIF